MVSDGDLFYDLFRVVFVFFCLYAFLAVVRLGLIVVFSFICEFVGRFVRTKLGIATCVGGVVWIALKAFVPIFTGR